MQCDITVEIDMASHTASIWPWTTSLCKEIQILLGHDKSIIVMSSSCLWCRLASFHQASSFTRISL